MSMMDVNSILLKRLNNFISIKLNNNLTRSFIPSDLKPKKTSLKFSFQQFHVVSFRSPMKPEKPDIQLPSASRIIPPTPMRKE
ncbi:hypothetical protein SESBI_26842 [Sesbania bispinosa]|nr:hypothetical protein SESBI_26842 [Sesbania bispinosa]